MYTITNKFQMKNTILKRFISDALERRSETTWIVCWNFLMKDTRIILHKNVQKNVLKLGFYILERQTENNSGNKHHVHTISKAESELVPVPKKVLCHLRIGSPEWMTLNQLDPIKRQVFARYVFSLYHL